MSALPTMERLSLAMPRKKEQWNERTSDDGAAVFSNATQKVCAAKILRGEEAQWSERTAGFL